jgi:tetratricopeptide (TPR) repeat protein
LQAQALWLALIAACTLALLHPASAFANDLDQFQNARAAYDSQNYELAADLFRNLLAESAPDDRRPLALESRKYLAAAVLFMGRKHEAEAQFEQLLRVEPDYVLDPLAFPDEVALVFNEVKSRLSIERARTEEERLRAQAAQSQQKDQLIKQRRENLDRLIELASTERVEVSRSRWIAMMPFGIGQFQNDHDGLGLVLAVSEGALLGIAITTFFLHEHLRGQHPDTPQLLENARTAETVYRYTNEISIALFGVVAVTGIIDAQLRFKPSSYHERQRMLPPDLTRFDLSVGPGGMSLTGSF